MSFGPDTAVLLSPPAVDLALIGNCGYQALVDTRGNVVWLCWPRFDSPFVFGDLLDDERGGVFSIQPAGSFTSRAAYEEHSNVLRTTFEADDGAFELVDFAPRFFEHERSFKPRMLVRRVRVLRGAPSIRIRCVPSADYGREHPEPTLGSNHMQWRIGADELRLTTDAPIDYVAHDRSFVLDRDVDCVLTWGAPLEAPLRETCDRFLRRTQQYWERWVKHCVLPSEFQEEVIRSALALKLHQYEDTGAITAAATTSLPEHPGSGRNWDYRFCWIRDSAFTVGALRRLGQFEEMEGFVTYLRNLVARSDGAVQPVYGLGGEDELEEKVLEHLKGNDGAGMVRVGNAAYEQVQHDVYGEMLAALAPAYLDTRFRKVPGLPLVHQLADVLESVLEAPDVGLWEKRDAPRLHTFTLLLHWVGAKICEEIARVHADPRLEAQAAKLGKRASELIEQAWRPELGYFADAVDSDEPDASLLMMVNLGYLGPDDPRANRHVDGIADALRAGPHLLYRYKHDDGLGDTVAAFTVCGFWHAEALAKLGRTEDAHAVFAGLLSHANAFGLLSEDVDPSTGALWGNFPQTYSHVGIINTAFALSEVMGPAL